MRITLVADAFYPAVDGCTRTVKAVADHLVDTGHEVGVLAPGPGLPSYRGCPVVRTGGRLRLAQRVAASLADLRPDVVHVLGTGQLGRTAHGEATRLGIPVVALPPGAWTPGVDAAAFHPGLRDPWLHASWSRARSRSGASVVRAGVVVGFAGDLEAHHGVRRLAELAGLPGVRPVVIGDGSLRGWLRDRLPDARFTRPQGTGDLATALASLDVLVHPGEHGTCCQSLREAAASGVPAVAARSREAARVVRTLESGLLYDPTRPGGLREAVASVAADPRRSLLGGRARELVIGRTWAAAVDELVERHYRPARDRVAEPVGATAR